MTLHTKRTSKPARGHIMPHNGRGGTLGIMVRVPPDHFQALRKLAGDARVPMAYVIRTAIAKYLKSKGLTP